MYWSRSSNRSYSCVIASVVRLWYVLKTYGMINVINVNDGGRFTYLLPLFIPPKSTALLTKYLKQPPLRTFSYGHISSRAVQ